MQLTVHCCGFRDGTTYDSYLGCFDFSISFHFLQIRPIDKKLEYQIKKLTKATGNAVEQPHSLEKENGATAKKEGEEFLKYRPRPDLLVSKTDITPEVVKISVRKPYYLFFIWEVILMIIMKERLQKLCLRKVFFHFLNGALINLKILFIVLFLGIL